MTEHLQEISSNGFLEVGSDRSSVGYKLVATQEQDAVRVALSVMVPRDWLLSKGFRREATLLASNDQRIPVSFDGELDVSDSIAVSLRADDALFPSVAAAHQRFPELQGLTSGS